MRSNNFTLTSIMVMPVYEGFKIAWSWLRPRCPIRTLFGVKCPTCGLGTAFLHLFRGEFYLSWQSHPLAILSPLIIFFFAYFKGREETVIYKKVYRARWGILITYTLWGVARHLILYFIIVNLGSSPGFPSYRIPSPLGSPSEMAGLL